VVVFSTQITVIHFLCYSLPTKPKGSGGTLTKVKNEAWETPTHAVTPSSGFKKACFSQLAMQMTLISAYISKMSD
jgi:hypothetical protein